MMIPTVRQIEAQVAALLQHDGSLGTLGIHAPRPGAWPEQVRVGPRDFRLKWCESPLAVREALLAGAAGTGGLVILTGAPEQDLGADLLARLARGRVFRLRSWDLVRELFQAREIDPRLGRLDWIGDLLIERVPSEGYPAAPGGFLCADLAWRQVLTLLLGLPEARPDALALMEWTLTDEASARWSALPEGMRGDLADWLAAGAGPCGRALVACIAAGRAADCLPLGLVCELIFAVGNESDPLRAAAAARLEPYTAGLRIARPAGLRWAETALAALERISEPARVRALLARADQLLDAFGLAPVAESSAVLEAGLEARLLRYAVAIEAAIEAAGDTGGGTPPLLVCETAASRVLAHRQATGQPARCLRIEMSLRLLRWLATPEPAPADLADAAEWYARDGAWVDWARMTLFGGDALGRLSAALAALAAAVRVRRERFNRVFAERLTVWNAAGQADPRLVPVEAVLAAVVAPLAGQCPVLLLVADGMSLPVLRALSESLEREGWVEAGPRDGTPPLAGLAVLPTLTESSRTSLLCGDRALGSAAQEKNGFAACPALLAVSRPGARPVLFHKAELGDGSGLALGVRQALGAQDQKVVGVVYNAVDDHLAGSDQLHQGWSVADLRLLGPLLHEARLARRALIITADHGHVLEDGTNLQAHQGAHQDGDRWRYGGESPGPGEVAMTGGRVLLPSGALGGAGARSPQVVMAWSETLRYAGKRNGYHGGASPQEVLVPLVTLLPAAQDLAGWTPLPPALPEWWDRSAVPAAAPVPPIRVAATTADAAGGAASGKRPKAAPCHDDLFATPPPVSLADSWAERLLASPIYAEQKRLAARIAPGDEDLRRFLLALDSRGGKLGKTALAQRLGMPLVRIGGFLSAVRRVLNLDRAAVVIVDEAAGTVELNRNLLEVQFQLDRR